MSLLRSAVFATMLVVATGSAVAGVGPGASSKLHHALTALMQYSARQSTLSASARASGIAAYARRHSLTVKAEKVLVEILVADTSAAFVAGLSRFGILHDRSFGRINHRIQALVPITRL